MKPKLRPESALFGVVGSPRPQDTHGDLAVEGDLGANRGLSASTMPLPAAEDTAAAPSQEGTKRPTAKSSPFRGVTLFKPTMKWRAQISAGGKTTSLGDHDTEEEAARAFDRAAINKAGTAGKTNFSMEDYKDEIADLQAMQQTELVAMLRSKARKSSTQTSHYRGVSLLKQTQKWHAQINVGGKQVHLGFFATEEEAARAYDRAAINKGARDGGKIITNMDIAQYDAELDKLRRIGQRDLVEALASEVRRRQTMELLAHGTFASGEDLFGSGFDASPVPQGISSIAQILSKAERAQPKPTQANPLYANFGKKREGSHGEVLPLVTRPPNFPPPVAKPFRRPGRPRTLFQKRGTAADSSSESSGTESDEDEDHALQALEIDRLQQPTRRSARNANRAVKHYAEQGGSDAEASGAEEEPEAETPTKPLATPKQSPASLEWGAASPPYRQKRKPRARKAAADSDSGSESEGRGDARRRREEPPAAVEPAQPPTWELLAYAVAAARKGKPSPSAEAGQHNVEQASSARVPSADLLPRFDSVEAATAGSRATATVIDPITPPPLTADKGSQAFVGNHGQLKDTHSVVTISPEEGVETTPAHEREGDAPSVAQNVVRKDQEPPSTAARGSEEPPSAAPGASVGEKGSVAMGQLRDKASTLAGQGSPLGDKISDARFAFPLRQLQEPSSAQRESPGIHHPRDESLGNAGHDASPVSLAGTRSPPRRAAKRRSAWATEGQQAKTARSRQPGPLEEEDAKPAAGRAITTRQKAMLRRQEQRRLGPGAVESGSLASVSQEPSPKSSFAANVQPSPRHSTALNQSTHAPGQEGRQRLQEDAASRSFPQPHSVGSDVWFPGTLSSSEDSHGPQQRPTASSSEELNDALPRREGPNRRKRKQPARSAI